MTGNKNLFCHDNHLIEKYMYVFLYLSYYIIDKE